MNILHPEFLFLMIPLVGILFYFWFTQKRHNEHHFSQEVLEKLRVNESTLGLNGRNGLFLSASLLIIIALSQPVAKQEKIIESSDSVTLALDISIHPLSEFEGIKKRAIHLTDTFEGAVEVVAFDSKVYRIAPSSNDKKMLKELIKNLSPHLMNTEISDENNVYKVCKSSTVVIVGNKTQETEMIERLKKPKEHWIYFQLFYFPLGLAMILIAIALSSMSKRQSVSMAFALIIFTSQSDVHAGVMDFRLLEKANDAYSNGKYEQSARLFGEYQRLHDSPQIRYNHANALFKAGHYERARYWYERVFTSDAKLREWVEINKRKLPLQVNDIDQTPLKEKNVFRLKNDKRNTEKAIEIVNATPIFSY